MSKFLEIKGTIFRNLSKSKNSKLRRDRVLIWKIVFYLFCLKSKFLKLKNLILKIKNLYKFIKIYK